MGSILYPGTFDPITNGHLDLIKRATFCFNKVIIGVSTKLGKSPLFTIEERVDLIHEALVESKLNSFTKVIVLDSGSLTVEEADRYNSDILRGIRSVTDFDYEFQMTLTNSDINKSVQTIFMIPSKEYMYVSSSVIRELAYYGKYDNIKLLVPKCVLEAIELKG